MPSPVGELNRAVAHSMAFGPEAGLALIDTIAGEAALRNYAPLPAARGDFLLRAGRAAEAKLAFEAAAALAGNERGDRKSVVEGKSVSVRVALGGPRILKKKKKNRKM